MKILEKNSFLNNLRLLLIALPPLGIVGHFFNISFLKYFVFFYLFNLIILFRIVRRRDFHFQNLKYLGELCLIAVVFREEFPPLDLLSILPLFCLLGFVYPKREHLF